MSKKLPLFEEFEDKPNQDEIFMDWWNDNYSDGEEMEWDSGKEQLIVTSEDGEEMERIPYSKLKNKIKGLSDNPEDVFG